MITREQIGKVYMYFVFILWSGTEVLIGSTLENILWWKKEVINDHIAIITLILLVINIVFFQKYTLRELITIGILSGPIIIATLNSGHNVMMSTWIFIIAMKNMDFNTLARAFYYVELFCTIFIIYFFKMGYIGEFTIYSHEVLRHSFGFTHPNLLGIRIFLLVICRCYIHRERFNIFDWAIIIAAAAYVNRVSNSKTSCYALIILSVIMAFYMLVQFFGKDLKTYSEVMIIITVGSMLLSVGMSMINCRKYRLLRAFDLLMSSRFSKSFATRQYYGIKLLGQRIRLIFTNPGTGKTYHFWLDNAYMSILLRYGILVFAIITILYVLTMIRLKNADQHILVAILCLYAIYGIMENNFFYMSQNIFLLLLSYPLYFKNSIPDIEKKTSRIRLAW